MDDSVSGRPLDGGRGFRSSAKDQRGFTLRDAEARDLLMQAGVNVVLVCPRCFCFAIQGNDVFGIFVP